MEHIGDGKDFGALIRAKRQERGWSIRTAASRAQVSVSSLRQWESGKMPMGRVALMLLVFYRVTATVGAKPVREEER